MPLPPALAARLQKRGLLQNNPEVKPPPATSLNTPGKKNKRNVLDYLT